MSHITCKFGGSSLADADCIRRAIEIIRANPERRFIVPSAPGKRSAEDKKVTDLLYAWHNLAREGLDASQPRGMIAARFEELAAKLQVDFDVHKHLETTAAQEGNLEEPDFMASRGEYLNGLLIAELLKATFVEPAECIRFLRDGNLDPVTYELMAAKLHGPGLFVIPGFYGALPDGRIKTFSRGGSDVTGAIVARASKSRLYENWTDVSGFRMADPTIVPEAKRIDEVTYLELRELSYMGAKVLHDEAIFPVREPGIPINIRNTTDPDNPGTMIVAEREAKEPVCGIAGQAGFTMISIAKTLMNKEVGFGLRVLEVLVRRRINFEHIATGIDTISVIVKDEELRDSGPSVLDEIERVCQPDSATLTPGLAMVATVGQGMAGHVGVAAKLCKALADANVNIRVIDQGSSENNIIIGVVDKDLAGAVKAIHHAFAA
jgi:aspartate kinase